MILPLHWLRPGAVRAPLSVSEHVPGTGVCAACRHASGSGAHFESMIPGLSVFGSGYGASVGDSLLCARRDCLVGPRDGCNAYEAADGG
jgi:hypothetical protein